MGFDGREAGSWVEVHQIHLEVVPQVAVAGQVDEASTLEPGVVGLLRVVTLSIERRWGHQTRSGLPPFPECEHSRRTVFSLDRERGVGRQVSITTCWHLLSAAAPCQSGRPGQDIKEVLNVIRDRLRRTALGF